MTNSRRGPGDKPNKRPGNDNTRERPLTGDECDCPSCSSDMAQLVPCMRRDPRAQGMVGLGRVLG